MPQSGDTDMLQDNPLLRKTGPVAEVILNAPKRKNALSLAAWKRLPGLAAQIAADPQIRVCVVRGSGGESFCAGADIAEFEDTRATPDAAAAYDAINVQAFAALKSLPMPVIAAIEGPCLGGGLGVALACDIRLASRTAVFGIPAARLGLAYPPEALSDLLETVSPSAAKRLLFTAGRITAEAAIQMGLVDEISEPDTLASRLQSLCGAISANAPLSIRAAKACVNDLSGPAAEKDLRQHREAATQCIDSSDYREGCRAFLDKRPPVFTGQ